MNIYRHNDYIDALSEIVESRKKINKKFTYLKIAQAINVHRPYLSRVIKKKADLSDDQWFDLLNYLELNDEEKNFLTLVHQYTKSSNRRRKKLLIDQIKLIRKNKTDSTKELEAKIQNPMDSSGNDAFTEYYLNPNLQIIHFYFTIEEVQKKPSLICERWKISPDELSSLIKKLEKLGFIKFDHKEKRHIILIDHMHLNSQHMLTKYSQSMLRLKSLEQVSNLEKEQCYNFAITLSTDDDSRAQLQQEFMNFLKLAEKIVRKSNPKRVFQMNFDLFPWEKD